MDAPGFRDIREPLARQIGEGWAQIRLAGDVGELDNRAGSKGRKWKRWERQFQRWSQG